jgi:hypothetical protein
MSELLMLPTSKLRAGDVVVTYGMRVRLPAEPRVYENHGHEGRAVYAWDGIVENLDEVVADGFVPRSFLTEELWVDGKGWVFELTGCWVIQGNDLAIWAVERAAE